VRFSLLLLLCLQLNTASAWSGIGAFLGQADGDWRFSAGSQNADIDFYGLQIEDRTQSPLRVGAGAGQFDLRLLSTPAAAERFSGKFLTLFLRLPQSLGDQVKLHSQLSYQYNLGEKSLQGSEQISWSEVMLQLGVSLQLGRLSVQPYGILRSIDGDITTPSQTRLFQHEQSSGYGVKLDYYVEPTAYIRFLGSAGANESLSISFVREY
jgi:hypothetical protein